MVQVAYLLHAALNFNSHQSKLTTSCVATYVAPELITQLYIHSVAAWMMVISLALSKRTVYWCG